MNGVGVQVLTVGQTIQSERAPSARDDVMPEAGRAEVFQSFLRGALVAAPSAGSSSRAPGRGSSVEGEQKTSPAPASGQKNTKAGDGEEAANLSAVLVAQALAHTGSAPPAAPSAPAGSSGETAVDGVQQIGGATDRQVAPAVTVAPSTPEGHIAPEGKILAGSAALAEGAAGAGVGRVQGDETAPARQEKRPPAQASLETAHSLASTVVQPGSAAREGSADQAVEHSESVQSVSTQPVSSPNSPLSVATAPDLGGAQVPAADVPDVAEAGSAQAVDSGGRLPGAPAPLGSPAATRPSGAAGPPSSSAQASAVVGGSAPNGSKVSRRSGEPAGAAWSFQAGHTRTTEDKVKSGVVGAAGAATAASGGERSASAGRSDGAAPVRGGKDEPRIAVVPPAQPSTSPTAELGGRIEASQGQKTTASSVVFEQIAEPVRRLEYPGNSHLQLRLHPEALGTVDLRLVMKDGVLGLEIQASTDHGRSLIEGALPQLRHVLVDRGIDVGNLAVTQGGVSLDGGLTAGSGQRSGWTFAGWSGGENSQRGTERNGQPGGGYFAERTAEKSHEMDPSDHLVDLRI